MSESSMMMGCKSNDLITMQFKPKQYVNHTTYFRNCVIFSDLRYLICEN